MTSDHFGKIAGWADIKYSKQSQNFNSTNATYVLDLSIYNRNEDLSKNTKSNSNNTTNNYGENNNNSNKIFIESHEKSKNNNGVYSTLATRENIFFYFNQQNGRDDIDRLNTVLNRGPFFDVSASKNVTALVGKTANLNCRIKNLGNKTVTKPFYIFEDLFLSISRHISNIN